MIWLPPRPILVKFFRSRQLYISAGRYPRSLRCRDTYANVYLSSRSFSATSWQRSPTDTTGEASNFVHNVSSALRVASQESVPVTVISTIRTIRRQKKHAFAKLGDGSTISELQVLLSPSQAEELATGTTVRIVGVLQPCPPGLQQSHELHATEVTIIGHCDPETYPIQKKYHTQEFLRTLPHLRLRTPWNGLLARLRSDVEYSCSEWFHQHGYIRAHPPIITSSDCEGAGEVFTVTPASDSPTSQEGQIAEQHFFREPKYLTVSSQLHLEAYVHIHRAVWTLNPTFRAERSDTSRHLSEFYMLEAELQTTSLSDVMDVVESLLRHTAGSLSKSDLGKEMLSATSNADTSTTTSADQNSSPDSPDLSARWAALRSPNPYPRITYTEAISHLQRAAESNPQLFNYAPAWGISLALEHEKHLADTIGNGTTPIFVIDYPAAIKPFYMAPSAPSPAPSAGSHAETSNERQTVACFDLLLPSVAELVGGSLREHRHGALQAAMRDKGVSEQSLEWYLALRRYGSVPHGGFGMGFDRLLCYLSGETNVRDVVGWPRWVGRCEG